MKLEHSSAISKRASFQVPESCYGPSRTVYSFSQLEFERFCKAFKAEIEAETIKRYDQT